MAQWGRRIIMWKAFNVLLQGPVLYEKALHRILETGCGDFLPFSHKSICDDVGLAHCQTFSSFLRCWMYVKGIVNPKMKIQSLSTSNWKVG